MLSTRQEKDRPAPRVLVVDDYTPFRRATARLLAQRNFEVGEARDGEAALKMARREAWDAVLLDLKLGPPLSGGEVLRRLQADQATARIPVIAMSGEAWPSELPTLLCDGAADFVAKGRSADLMAAVDRVVFSPTPVGADVLYLEDDDDWALLVEQWLRPRGLKVHRLRSRAEVLAYLSFNHALPRCLVLDLSIGADEDGLALCDEIKAAAAYQSVPIIVFTAKDVPMADCLNHQALQVVRKDAAAKTNLEAVLGSVLKQQARSRGVIECGDLTLDSRTGVLLHEGRAQVLTGGNLSAFVRLLLASPRPVADLDLYRAFLSRGSYQTPHDDASLRSTVRTYVSALRKALGEPLGERVVCVKDSGYAYQR